MTCLILSTVVDDVKMLLEQGKSKKAYELGRQHPERLGDPLFDFFYGVAQSMPTMPAKAYWRWRTGCGSFCREIN
ncbi:MAG TPA: hypothetical protein VHE58_08825 [Burkholderiales bacterium]|nr:hypothetical protein [Burkholderiales bacterium]